MPKHIPRCAVYFLIPLSIQPSVLHFDLAYLDSVQLTGGGLGACACMWCARNKRPVTLNYLGFTDPLTPLDTHFRPRKIEVAHEDNDA